mmetsp:Transcript_43072/g.41418  ORF Transcript_43072/g.41418 Transcript_43072/m.41418 type:complete len:127 (+) Transcript_43072:183-563(+)
MITDKLKDQTKLLMLKSKNEQMFEKLKEISKEGERKDITLNYFQRKYNNVDIDTLHERIRELETDVDQNEQEKARLNCAIYEINSTLQKNRKKIKYLINRLREIADVDDKDLMIELIELKEEYDKD